MLFPIDWLGRRPNRLRSTARLNHEVENLFHELADLPAGQRESYLSQRQVSAEVRAEVEELLRFDSASSSLQLTACVADSATRSLDLNPALEGGAHCGPYRLLRVLGRGGMGSVYLAERADGEVQQQVAIKLLRQRGDEPLVRDRFQRERQILATLSHPNVARLLDVGHTDDGQPYLVMEYVSGVPVDAYAEGLDLRGKLELFLKVCGSISYAHRNLIIHRDLKPSNILVEKSGEPKLLDFGIAKILDATMDATATQDRVLTPAYASPEQVRGTAQATTSDVYSLGAVLYRLLTGRSPHEISTQSQEAIELAVCLKDPTVPSRVNASLPKDLDFIVMKALRKEPEARYGSVDALADDVRAFLESRPVLARSGNAWYRTQKFVRRYWVPMTAASLVVVSLSVGLFIANRERAIAQRRFEDVRQLSNKLFEIDTLAQRLPGSTKTRQLIVDTSLEYLGRLARDVQGDPGLALELGNAYRKVAEVQGVPVASNLGQVDQAEKNLQIADRLIQSALKQQPGNRTARLQAAEVARDRMTVADMNEHDMESRQFADESVAALEQFHAQPGDRSEARTILYTYLSLAQKFEHDQRTDEALALCNRGSELSKIFERPTYGGAFLQTAAKVYQGRGDLDHALRSIQESGSLLKPKADTNDQAQVLNYVMGLVYEGGILGGDYTINLGRDQEAAGVLERAFQITDARVHQDANDQNSRGRLEMAGYPLANLLRHTDAGRSLEVYDHTLRHLGEVPSNPNVQLYQARALAGSSYSLRKLGRLKEARERLDAAFQLLLQLKMYPADRIPLGSGAHRALAALADWNAESGDVSRALALYQELLDKAQGDPAKNLDDALDQSSIFTGMAVIERRAGHAAQAASLDARRLDLWRGWEKQLPGNAYVLRQIAQALHP